MKKSTIFFILFCLSINLFSNENEKTQRQSLALANYMAVVTNTVKDSRRSQTELEDIFSDLINNTNRAAIDEESQTYMRELRNTIMEFKLLDEKRRRIQFLNEKLKSDSIKAAVPNPMYILSADLVTNPIKSIATIGFMALDSTVAIPNARSAADLAFIQQNWVIDDAEQKFIGDIRSKLFDYMINMIREYKIPDSYMLRESTADEFVKKTASKNPYEVIEFLTNKNNAKAYINYAPYWLELAKAYYQIDDYKNCLSSFDNYKTVSGSIFNKDREFAKTIPIAIVAAEFVLSKAEYVEYSEHLIINLIDNTDNRDWDLRFIAAQTYLYLAKITGKENYYLDKAYEIILSNVNFLIDEQKELTRDFNTPLPELRKDATDLEKKEYKLMKEYKKELFPCISIALTMNCSFAHRILDEMNRIGINIDNYGLRLKIMDDVFSEYPLLSMYWSYEMSDEIKDEYNAEFLPGIGGIYVPMKFTADSDYLSIKVVIESYDTSFDDTPQIIFEKEADDISFVKHEGILGYKNIDGVYLPYFCFEELSKLKLSNKKLYNAYVYIIYRNEVCEAINFIRDKGVLSTFNKIDNLRFIIDQD